ncbi:MAG TPA: alpha/beta hydrolase [Mycobacterium sp.]|uniref:alpha/beta hydrolase n=1 Tax=Mycobacterium sp. TaxID=1785 RepID=UPI002F40DE64
MASNEAIGFADFLATLSSRSSDPRLDLPTVRDIIETIHLATKEPEGVSYAEQTVGGVEALWCIPAGTDDRAVILHNHMGGTVVASMHSDRKAAAHIAKAAGVPSLVLNYRQSPEHKFPAQIEDVDNAYRWLLEQGYRPENIASAGHSIGANFALSLALRLRDSGDPLPGAILSISPWVDMTLANPTIDSNAGADKLLSRPLLEFFRSLWLDETGVEWNDARVTLLAADLTGLPPTAIYYGADEILAGEATQLAHRAQAAGNDVLLRAVPAGQHSFIVAAGRVPEVDDAIKEMGSWLRIKLGLSEIAAARP